MAIDFDKVRKAAAEKDRVIQAAGMEAKTAYKPMVNGAALRPNVGAAPQNTKWVSTGAGRKSTVGDFNTAMDQLKAERRQAAVTQNDVKAKQIYDQMKALRASFGKQTLGDRLVDMTETAFGRSAGNVVNAAGAGIGAVNELERIFKGDDKRAAQAKMEETRRALETGILSDGRPVTDAMRPTLEAMLADYQAKYEAAEELDPFEVRHQKLAKVEQSLYDAADAMSEEAAEDEKYAKAGLGAAGQFAVGAGIAGMQLYGDAVAGRMLGVGTLPMGARVFGGAAQEARQAGADTGQQLSYGLSSAIVSMLTEKIANVAGSFKNAFGKGVMDDMLAKVSAKPGGKLILSALSEGGEEMFENAMQPLLQRMSYDPTAAYDKEWLAETFYSGAVGAVLGGFGGGVDVVGNLGNKTAGKIKLQMPDISAQQKNSNQIAQNKTASPNKGETVEVIKVLANNIPMLQTKQPVATTSAQVLKSVQGNTMAEKARKLFDGIKGIVTRQGFGEIEINGRSVKDDLNHGIGPAKAATIMTVPQVIQHGEQIDFQPNWKGRPYDGYTFAAPVIMDGETVYVAAVVKKTNKNRFYLHEVIDSKGNIIKMSDEESANQTSPATNGDAGTQSPSLNISVPGNQSNVNVENAAATGLKMPPRTPQAVVMPTLTGQPDTQTETAEKPKGVVMPTLTGVPDPALNPTTQMVKNAYQKVKKARREKERAKYWNKLEPYEQRQVERLMEGDITLANLNPAKVNVPGIKAVYEATMEYENLMKSIREYKSQRKKMLRDEADKDVSTALNWIDKAAGILYSRETMERNIRDIVPDKAVANNIIRKYFKPVHDSQAMATRVKNDYRDRVRKLGLSQKVANGNQVSEAYAVQLLGEAEHHIRELEEDRKADAQRDGKTLDEWKAVVQDLWENNPKLNKEKIAAAVNEFRTIYDELFQQMNEVLIRNGYEPVAYRRGYFPHFQSNDSGMLAKIGKHLGITTDVTALPTSINGLTHTFKPGKSWFGHAQERKGFATDYDAVQGFDKYIEGAADIIHQTDNIQRLRALEAQIRYRTTDDGIRKQIDKVRNNKDLTEEKKEEELDKIYEKGKFALSNFAVELREYTNLLANKKSLHDRSKEQDLGRDMYNKVKALESRVAANMVAINPASWLTNFIPVTQGAATLDNKALLKGMWETLKAYKTDDGMVDVSTFLTNRRGSDPLVKTWSQKASAVMASPMEFIDNFTADTLVRARYYQNLDKGLSEAEALNEADSWAAGVMADRSKGAMPTLFNRANPLTKMFTQFQLEVNNQFSYLFKDVPDELKEKGLKALATGLLKMFVGAWLYNEVYEYIVGRRPALDPIDILLDTTGDLTGFEIPNTIEAGVDMLNGETVRLKKDRTGVGEAGTNLATNILEELPFVSALNLVGVNVDAGRIPVASAIPDLGNLWDAISEKDWAPEKRKQELTKEVIKPLLYVAAPFGGGQIKKVMQGLKAVKEGGSYTVNAAGEDILQYPVYTDTKTETAVNAARAMIFGKSSLPTARQWVEGGFSGFGAKETATYQGLVDVGVSQKDAYALIDELRKVKKTDRDSEATLKRETLRKSAISEEGKSIVYYSMLASEKEQELMDKIPEKDLPAVANTLMIIKDANDLTGTKAYELKRNALQASKASEATKIMVYETMISDSKQEEIEIVLDAGLGFDRWLRFENDIAGLASDEIRTKKEKVMNVIDKMNITDDQKTALYLAAGYKQTTLDDAPWIKKNKKGAKPTITQKLYMPKRN